MRPSINTRDTGPRRAISALIAERHGHFTAADLLADAHSNQLNIGRATIFRTLDLLADQGSLERLDLPSGEHAYVRVRRGAASPPRRVSELRRERGG